MDEANESRAKAIRQWAALRSACQAQHPGGPGGARVCVCGANCGGSDACTALANVKALLTYLDPKDLPHSVRGLLVHLKDGLH